MNKSLKTVVLTAALLAVSYPHDAVKALKNGNSTNTKNVLKNYKNLDKIPWVNRTNLQ